MIFKRTGLKPIETTHGQRRHAWSRCRSRGFTLIVTLSLMILITLIAVGLLTLSSVSLRGATQTQAQATARTNARLALALAIGELQKQTGPDTRVTARADILKPANSSKLNPPVLGVWKSWQGDDHEKSGAYAGRPVSPGDYQAAKKARFLTWLVSGNPAVPANSDTVPDTTAGTGKIALVGPGSAAQGTGNANMPVNVNLAPVKLSSGNGTGSFAWWVSGENQKARIPKPYKPSNDSVAGWAPQVKSHTVVDPSVFRMDPLLTDAAPANKAITLRQGDLIAPPGTLGVSKDFFHDLSAVSVGLLTNTATGGWRKDLSLLTENWDQEPKSNQPFFRVKPGQDIAFTIPVSGGSHRPDKSLFYPWSAYRGNTDDWPTEHHGAVTSWENLRHWATLYKQMNSGGTSIAPFACDFNDRGATNVFNYLHRTRIVPLIARIQWVFSHYATKDSATPPNYTPQLLITPIITLWNPYNVSINSSPNIEFALLYCTPEAFRFQVGTVKNTLYNSVLNCNNSSFPPANTYSPASLTGQPRMFFKINSTYTFNPGETLLFSPAATPAPFSSTITLTPGARLKGGFYVPIRKDDGSQFAALPGGTNVKPEARFDAFFNDGGGAFFGAPWQGTGIIMDENDNGQKILAYRYQVYPDVASAVFKLPANTALSPATLSQSVISPQPFMTTVFGARTASQTFFPGKGFVQSSPFVNITTMGGARTSADWQPQLQYPGTAHPVNSPFDFSFRAVAPFDSLLPNADAANRGFIVSGFQSSDGLSRCIIDELPTQPIQSLAELQNWNLRSDNPIPPFCFNIVGNSDATPLIPANTVFNYPPTRPPAGQELQYDDFYCANHLLFDDWFASSIAPKSANLGVPASSATSKKTFTDFVSGKNPLPNRAYLPIKADAAAAKTTAGADGLFAQYASKAGAWKSIASRIEVEGMFNVNSTSVKAWRALLGHARDQKIPYVIPTGNTLSDKQDYAFSHFSVAGDVEAKSIGTSGQFSTCAEFAGYRKLTGPVLDRFAEEIVNQVRARGPFLSLSEFVNRQLTYGNLALAGTIQAALNTLANDNSTNPYSVIQAGSTKVDLVNLPFSARAGYSFPAAAEGYSAYGLPGWTRQADVLRPIAPILSARDDTFTIRAYGDARDNSGNITARATCEAVVRRTRNFVDPADAADITTQPKSAANLNFGRRYEIISFRWLNNSEI
jgi:hypothetical protein